MWVFRDTSGHLGEGEDPLGSERNTSDGTIRDKVWLSISVPVHTCHTVRVEVAHTIVEICLVSSINGVKHLDDLLTYLFNKVGESGSSVLYIGKYILDPSWSTPLNDLPPTFPELVPLAGIGSMSSKVPKDRSSLLL
jgi:hypothetical protein